MPSEPIAPRGQPTPVALITGASSGVGEELCVLLASRGWRVAAVARSASKLAALSARQAGIQPVVADVTDHAAITAAVARVESELGPITALVNNAAVFEMRAFAEQDPATIAAIIDTNLKGTLWVTHAVVPRMLARRAGRIVNIASVAGTRGIPGQAAYCASKHGMVGFAEALAQELLPAGITVSTICPGGIDTPLWTGPDGANPYPGDREKLISPREIAELVEFVLTRPAGTVYKRITLFPGNEWH